MSERETLEEFVEERRAGLRELEDAGYDVARAVLQAADDDR